MLKDYTIILTTRQTRYEPLDPALIRAILSEYDHNDTEQSKALHDTLEALRAEALVDDTSAFDPSGTSGGAGLARSSSALGPRDGSEAHTESGFTMSSDTDLTNLSHDVDNILISRDPQRKDNGEYSPRYLVESEAAEVQARLLELFPSQNATTIAHIVRKCNGSFDTAVDVLLNHVYFDEPNEGDEKVMFKSVDAFGEVSPAQRRRQKSRKKKNFDTSIDAWSSTESLSTTSSLPNHWNTAAQDIDFLATRTNTSSKTVQSLYNRHSASVSATIAAIVEQRANARQATTSDDPAEELNIATLASEFPSLPLSTVAGLVRVAAPSTAHAHELAKALVSPSPRAQESAPLIGGRLVPQYTPLRIDEGSTDGEYSSPLSATSAVNPLSAAALANLRSNAFNSASQYHRKAGSDRLYGGAAAYYGQLGREYHSQLRAATSSQADNLVASQSSGTMIDLHGVSVADAVRIAESKAKSWWEEVRLKESRSNAQRVGDGLVIVTGRGAHSKDGRARIGPAVTKALMAQGWKVEVRSGELAVMGKAKK